MDAGAEAGLALHEYVRDAHAHVAAERGEEEDERDGGDVVRDDDGRRLLASTSATQWFRPYLTNSGFLKSLGGRAVGVCWRREDADSA